jgi:biopolymer transport protein ExbD
VTLRRRHGFHNAFINLTPLIDMSLMLVVFFVLCLTTSQAAVRAMPVTLPEAGTAEGAKEATLEVAVDRAGAVTVDGKAIELPALEQRAHGIARASLLADRDAKHGRVVEVVDALRRAGVKDVYYATTKPLKDW